MYERSLRANAHVRSEVQADVVARLDALHTRLSDRGDNTFLLQLDWYRLVVLYSLPTKKWNLMLKLITQ